MGGAGGLILIAFSEHLRRLFFEIWTNKVLKFSKENFQFQTFHFFVKVLLLS